MGYWLKDFGAELHELEVAYNDVRRSGRRRALLWTSIRRSRCSRSSTRETPSGTLNDVAAIGPMAHSRGVLTIVDCVSSLGGIEFRTDDWQIDIAVAAAQKCLGGPPGITLMTVSDAAWDRIRANPSAPRASFLSMLDWKEQWIDGEKFPFTPSVVDMHGIEACCRRACSRKGSTPRSRATSFGGRLPGRRAGHGPRALAAQRGGHGSLRHGDRGARRADRHPGAVALPRALRRDDLRRAGSRQPRAHRPHGPDGAVALSPSSGCSRSAARLPTSAFPVKLGDGAEAALEVLSETASVMA